MRFIKRRSASLVLAAALLTAVVVLGAAARHREEPVTNSRLQDGGTYYVAPNGSNATTGTRSNPWATPAYGAGRLSPGDTLVILPGRYALRDYDDDIIRPPSGRAGQWITITGEANDPPVLAGRDNLAFAVDLSGCSYVRLQHLEICSDDTVSGAQRYFRDGIVIVEQPASQIELNNLHIHHLDEFGLNLQDIDNLDVLNCRIEYCGFGAMGGPDGEQGGWRDVLVKGCSLSYGGHYYQDGDGSDRPYDRPDGFGIEEARGPIEIADTVAAHNYGDGLDSKADKTYIHNCLVANNSCDGVKLWGDYSKVENCLIYGAGDGVGGASPWAGIVVGTSTPNCRFEFVNVTLHDNSSRRAYSLYMQYDDQDVPTTVVMRNCIVAGGFGVAWFAPGIDLTAENNIFYRPGGQDQVEANGRSYSAAELGELGPGNISSDPQFKNPAWGSEGDYHVVQGSPAVDAGTATGAPAVDLEYGARPAGAGYDIGCYEHSSESALAAPAKLKARAKSGEKALLKWKDRCNNEEGFLLERKEGESSAWAFLAKVKENVRKYTDRTVSAGTEYYYRVRAYSQGGYSQYSNTARVVAK